MSQLAPLVLEKVALITGSSRGIGRATALLLAQHGAHVAINYLHEHSVSEDNRAQSVVELIEEGGGSAFAVQADVGRRRAVARMMGEVLKRFGRIDILVNNAGITLHRSLLETNDREWERVFATNLRGSFYCSQLAAHQMIEQGGGGRIINLSSQVASAAIVDRCAYSSSKAGLEALTRCAALELGPYGITVNAVAPGATRTSINPNFADEAFAQKIESTIPLGKMAKPDEIASVILFLASEMSNHVTGEIIHVDGGHVAGKFNVGRR